MPIERAASLAETQAIDWLIRQRDPGFADWEGFTAWLEADAAHAELYDRLALADQDAAALLTSPPPPAFASAARPPRRIGRSAWLGAAAASMLALIGYASVSLAPAPYAVETAPGEQRSITLADGSRIDLNGGTRLLLDEKEPRFAELAHGEALFTIVHDAADPFVVETGGAVLRDAGTIFNVVREAGATELAVIEGAVLYNPEGEALMVPAGRGLVARDDADRIILSDPDPAAAAAWRGGRLVYRSAPLAEIAVDLSRNLGVPVTVAPEAAMLSFSGTILLEEDEERFFRRLGPLLGLEARREARGWRLTTGADGAP